MIYLYIVLGLLSVFFLILFGLYLYTFSKTKPRKLSGAYMQKKLNIRPHLKPVMENIEKLSRQSFEEVHISSFDGLKLVGNYYEIKPGAPLVIFFHGYRSSFERDGSGGFCHLAQKGCNILMVHQRSHGKSEGRTITFGAKEKYDCVSWVEYAVARFGSDVKIVLMGVSMGAATVLLASSMLKGNNVKGIMADCGYSSAKKIIQSEIGAIHLPKAPVYFLAKLSAKIFGRFKLDDADCCEAVSKTNVPLLIIHGEEDHFVPHYMAKEILESCKGKKTFLSVPGAGHAMSFYQDTLLYKKALNEFLDANINVQ